MQLLTFDFLILIVGVVIISILRTKNPSIFFLAKGVNIFLPPQQQTEQDKRKKNKKQEDQPLKIMEASINELKEFPLYSQYEKLFYLTLLLLFHWVITLFTKRIEQLPDFFKITSSLPHYLTILLLIYSFVYAWKVATHNGYGTLQIKTAFAATIVVFLIYGTVQLLLTTDTTISLGQAAQSLNQHLNLMFVGSQIQLDQTLLLFVILFISAILVFVTIPSIMKYGSIYTQLLKEAYLEEPDNSYPEDMKVAKAKVKLQSKKQLKILNVQLTLGIGLLVCWGIPPVRQQIPQGILTNVLICLTLLLSFVPIVTFKEQIELTMHGAYIHVKNYLNSQRTSQDLKTAQRRVYSYIYLFWYHSYQLLFKIAVPVLLLILAYQTFQNSPSYESKKYHYQISTNQGFNSTKVNLDVSCGLIKDPLLAIKHIYHCSRTLPSQEVKTTINGWQFSHQDTGFQAALKKVTQYGFMPIQFLLQFWSQILWYYLLSKYVLTIFYILFLRKTVLEL